MPELSVVILSYNTKSITHNCLSALYKSLITSDISSEIIIIDNNSNDGSKDMIEHFSKNHSSKKILIKTIFNNKNKGYSFANNQGLKFAKGKNILFINSDTIIRKISWIKLLTFLNSDSKYAVITVKVTLPSGKIDPASHRGFPTIWNSFCYFSGLENIFGKLPIIGRFFCGYHLLNLNLNSVHEIDSPSGTFYFAKSNIVKKMNGFDESFFMYGEDVDLSYRIKNQRYKIIYYPYYSVLHIKSVSGLKKENNIIRSSTRQNFYTAMKIFYDKHYSKKHSYFINKLVHFFIDCKLNAK